jgi:hypothetical protein
MRVGRSVGRTLYFQDGPWPSDTDPLVGLAQTAEIAGKVVDAVNNKRPAVPAVRWWAAGRLVYDRPGAGLVGDWIIAMDDPEDARRIVAAVRGEAA